MDKQMRDTILARSRLRVLDALKAAQTTSGAKVTSAEDLLFYQSTVLITLLLELVPMVELLSTQLQEINLKLDRIS